MTAINSDKIPGEKLSGMLQPGRRDLHMPQRLARLEETLGRPHGPPAGQEVRDAANDALQV